MIRVCLMMVWIGVALGATMARGGPVNFQSYGQKILIVGDSHLSGAYGKKLYQLLTSAPTTSGRREISLYSACGSTARDWSVFKPPRKRALCGLSTAKPYADFRSPIVPIRPTIVQETITQTVNGTRVQRLRNRAVQPVMPFLHELMQGRDFPTDPLSQRPDVFIVSLGTNMIGLVPENEDFETFYRSKVWAARKNYPGLFSEIDQIISAQASVAPAARCVWVGPPACNRMADGTSCFPRVEVLNRTLKRILRGRCQYIDALKVTTYPSGLKSDGHHFYGKDFASTATLTKIAEHWAGGVVQDLIRTQIIK